MRTEWSTLDRAEEHKADIEVDNPGFFAVVAGDDPQLSPVEDSYEQLGLLRKVFGS